MVELELELARNMFGKLSNTIRRRLRAVLANPSQETWEDTHGIILSDTGKMTTLWQAVMVVYPEFNWRHVHGEPWPEIPSREILQRAMRYATH